MKCNQNVTKKEINEVVGRLSTPMLDHDADNKGKMR